MYVETAIIDSPYGCFEIKGSAAGISSVKKLAQLAERTTFIPEVLRPCAEQLIAYFAGQLKVFDLKLDWKGATSFNIKVWEALLDVPYGHTTTYGAIAEEIGSPKAYQAVGLANKHNPIAIIVPCHRCLGKGGDLTGYFYGLEMKQALLQMENPKSFGMQTSLF